MPFVSDSDVQSHLPQDKLLVEGIPDDRAKIYLSAERIVRGYLVDVVDSSVLAVWTTPDLTPQIVREATGLFAAAEIYRIRFAEQSVSDPQRGKNLYDQAMAIVNGLLDGSIRIDGVDTTGFDNTYFEPNDASTDAPKFTMSAQF